jgi:hypothetical protein
MLATVDVVRTASGSKHKGSPTQNIDTTRIDEAQQSDDVTRIDEAQQSDDVTRIDEAQQSDGVTVTLTSVAGSCSLRVTSVRRSPHTLYFSGFFSGLCRLCIVVATVKLLTTATI